MNKTMRMVMAVLLLAGTRAAAQERDANTDAQLKAFREALPELVGKKATPETLQEALSRLEKVRALPGLTPAEQWKLVQDRLRIGAVWGGPEWQDTRKRDYPAALLEGQAHAPNLFEKMNLALLHGDVVMSWFPEEEAEARRSWASVSQNEEAPPYFRFLALDKQARSLLYVPPQPGHLGANFPEIRTVAPEAVRPGALKEAVALWREAIRLPLASWVRLNGIVAAARAHQSCGQPEQALAFIEEQLPHVTDVTVRERAEMNAIMADLADALGQRAKARTLRLAVLATPHVRPQLVETVQAASR